MDTILIVCAAGASSTFLASRIRAIAKRRNRPVLVEAVSQPELESRLSNANVLLIGPHLAADAVTISTQAQRFGVATALLPATAFKPDSAEECFDLATALLDLELAAHHQTEGISHG
ncbi:MAG: hypothetical protein JWQ43_4061 [Glaciihabitans sp.]|nr:hypothetical protein [Glaciihabitans sp.]